MAIILRCHRCEKDHEIPEKKLTPVIDCPHCNISAASENFSSVLFCPHCYAELLVPLDVLRRELQCPYCDKNFHANVTFSLSDDDDDADNIASESESSPLLKPGDIYDKYKVIKLLGRGGMGEVYLVDHLLLQRKIALKIMTNENAGNNSVYAKRFIREAKLANRIDSENFIAVYDVGKDNSTNTLFIAMEYVHGRNVNEIIKSDGVMNEREILKIALKVTEVLIILEREKIIHRDIKPSNIMISSSGVVKLADFGIAKSEKKEENELTLTQGNLVFGTPNYASPEQCRSSHNIDYRSDIYSLGATMFHMAAGQPPYAGTTAMETVIKVLNEEHKDLSKLTNGFSRGFISLVHDMLNRNPDKRPPNAEALKMRIEALLSDRKKIQEIIRIQSAVFASKMALLFFNIVNLCRKKSGRKSKKSASKFFKTLFKIILIIICISAFVKYRQKIFSETTTLFNSLMKTFNINQKMQNTSLPPSQPQEKEKITPAQTPPPAVKEKKEPEKTVPKKKIRKRKKRQLSIEEINRIPEKKEFTSPDKLQIILNKRLEKCNKELSILLRDESTFVDHKWFMERVDFYQKLQQTLFKQFKDRQKAFELQQKKNAFNKESTITIQHMIEEYSKHAGKTNTSARDKIFAQQLLRYLQNSQTDPNLSIKDSAHPEYSGPLLRWLEHADIPLKKELENELLIHYVSTDCIKGDCSLELCKYGIPNLNGMLVNKIKKKKYNDAIELINYGADVNEKDEQGRTPLHWAVFHDNLPLVRKLLIAGADIFAMTEVELHTPLFFAVKYASKEIYDLLKAVGSSESGTDVNNKKAVDFSYYRDFRNALYNNDLKKTKELLEKYPELCDEELPKGILPLQYSCSEYQSEIVIALLNAGADPNLRATSCAETPLQIAYEYPGQRKLPDNIRLIRWAIFNSLLHSGADASVKPLHSKYPTMLQYSCSNVNKIDERHMFFISSLIQKSDITKDIMVILNRFYEHKTPYYTNDRNSAKRNRILKLMMLKKTDLNQDAFDSLIADIAWSPKISEEEIDMLLECGARINGKNKEGKNALYYLCEWTSLRDIYIDAEAMEKISKRIKYLISKGIDVNCTVGGRTAAELSIPEMLRSALK